MASNRPSLIVFRHTGLEKSSLIVIVIMIVFPDKISEKSNFDPFSKKKNQVIKVAELNLLHLGDLKINFMYPEF